MVFGPKYNLIINKKNFKFLKQDLEKSDLVHVVCNSRPLNLNFLVNFLKTILLKTLLQQNNNQGR